MARISFIILFLFLVAPGEAAATFYACPSIDGDVYTESPSQADCRRLAIQPPALVYEPTMTMTGFIARPEGPWPSGSAEAEAEICGLYREWTELAYRSRSRLRGGVTPVAYKRLINLEQLFLHRGAPLCVNNP